MALFYGGTMVEFILGGDCETRSLKNLPEVGVHLYARHPYTKILVFSYTFDHAKTLQRWRPWLGQKIPSDFLDALHMLSKGKGEFRGWNAGSFERNIIAEILGIEIPPEMFHDTMIRARSMALPGSLELCAKALDMPIKKGDDYLMRKWCALQKDGTWADDPIEYEGLCDYCDDDVRSEAGIANLVRPLSPEERTDYAVNERINDRGLLVDISLARAAQRYAKEELADICSELNIITRGVVTSPKQYVRIKKWLAENLPEELQFVVEPDENGKVSFDARVREDLLGADYEDVLVGELRDFVELVHDGGKASTSKFKAMEARADKDQRVRGAYSLNGAAQTGRFSSSGLQVHNFIRAGLPNIEDVVESILRGDDPDTLIRLASYDADGGLAFTDRKRKERIKKPYNILTILSRTLRPAIIAPKGKVLVWRDWSSIEARMLPWLSLQNSASQVLDLFASGADVYKHQASMSFGVPYDDVTDIMRQGGKVQILSFGFGGGAGAGMRMARNYGLEIDTATADNWKEMWRQTNPWAKKFWSELEIAAFQAVAHPDTVYTAGRVQYLCTLDTLWCLLPSGRMICYPFPRIVNLPGRWGDCDTVTAMKGSFHPKKGTNFWPRMKLWGGFQAENVTQAEAASILRYSLRELDFNGWPIVGHTHDEIVEEVDEDEEEQALLVMKDIMENPPQHIFAGLPLASEAGSGYAYGK